MIAFLAEVLTAARIVWQDYQRTRDLEAAKRDLRDRADVALDNVAAKERLKRRKAAP